MEDENYKKILQDPEIRALLESARIFIVSGYPGSGKTFISRKLSDAYNAVHIRTGAVRRRLFSTPSYSIEESNIVHQEIMRLCSSFLLRNQKVIIDATLIRRDDRMKFFEFAREHVGENFVLLWITAPKEVLQKRIERRHCLDPSKASFEQIQLMRAQLENEDPEQYVLPTEDEGVKIIWINNS